MPVSNPGSSGPGYSVYSALIFQVGAAPPVESAVLVNTLGVITYGYLGLGTYTATSAGLFTANKTFILIGTPNDFSNSTPDLYIVEAKYSDVNTILINSINVNGFSINDNFISNPTPFEIRVYP